MKNSKIKGDISIRDVDITPKFIPDITTERNKQEIQLLGNNAQNILFENKTYNNAQVYLLDRLEPFKNYLNGIQEPCEKDFQNIDFNRLKNVLLSTRELKNPLSIRVTGTLFPSALLSSGWWNRLCPNIKKIHNWKDDLQKWLFYGFDLWGPSWAFTWNLIEKENVCAIAQFGEGDEANTIPVIIPHGKAIRLLSIFKESWGGKEVEISGIIGHEKHFMCQKVSTLVGGLLDFCLFLDENNKDHKIKVLNDKTDIYSGYLWKCLAPKKWITDDSKISLDNIYFIWEHTDFTKSDALKYNLESLYQKERYIENLHGELVLLQKSSNHIQGSPIWKTSEFYNHLQGKCDEII